MMSTTTRKRLKADVEDFLKASSQVGIQYLSGREKGPVRRCFWVSDFISLYSSRSCGGNWGSSKKVVTALDQLLVILSGAVASAGLFVISLRDWGDRPDVTTVESVTRPVEELKFPTVTVCPSKKQVPASKFCSEAL